MINFMNGREITKGDLLGHYAEKKPKKFLQYDCLPMEDVSSEHELSIGIRHELMSGIADVRVLITPGTPSLKAVELLRRIADHIETQPYDILPEEGYAAKSEFDFVFGH